MKFNSWQIPVTIVCVISGLLLSLQLQTVSVKPTLVSSMKNQDLVNMIKELEESTFVLEDEVDHLRREINDIQESRASGEARLNSLQRELTTLKDTTDLTEQTGDGIVLILDDHKTGAESAKSGSLEDYYPDDYIIHYKNLLYLVNELRGSSKAISINNQRIVSNTDIRCVGTVILVNTTRLAPPYEIRAIGNPDKLSNIVTSSYEYSYLYNRGFPIKLTKSDELTVPAHRGTYRFTYAEPIGKEGNL